MKASQRFQVLHISDLHIKEDPEEGFDRQVVLDPLIQRVRHDLEKGFQPEMVVVTGDIAFKGIEGEYALARRFFDDLLGALGFSDAHLFIVPGNHDVNRKKYRPKDIPEYDNMRELNLELADEDYRADLLKGMGDYFDFIEEYYPHLRSIEKRLVPFVYVHEARCGKKIGLVGLNSAWMCRLSDDERTIAVGEYQIQKAIAALEEQRPMDLRLMLMHHPLDWLWPVDRNICRTYMDGCILMAGHLHESRGGYITDLDGNLFSFQAGGAYVGTESDYPCRFHYLTVDWDRGEVKLDFRRFVAEKRRWVLDAESGEDGTKSFPMMAEKKTDLPVAEAHLEIPTGYVDWIADQCRYMDVEQLQVEGEAVRAELPEIFIPLFGEDPELPERESEIPDKRKDRRANIEALIAKHPHLLVEGEAGSGKTTLVKHLAFCLATGRLHDCRAADLAGWLPVLIFVKNLRGFFTTSEYRDDDPVSADDLLSYYCKTIGEVLDTATIDRFCEAQRALFLIDGLDEIDAAFREKVVAAFALLKTVSQGNRVVLSGRPHGVAGAARQAFGQYLTRIHSLERPQVEEFIHRWFAHIYSASLALGGKTARAMIHEVRAHPAVDQLIDNPLLLTATCILYYGGKSLPGQRAELYKKFVANMLHRRFPDDTENVLTFLSTLAFRMFESHVRGVDKMFAVEVLENIYRQAADVPSPGDRRRMEGIFERIEPSCGLLQRGSGEYTFRHLTFQEYLTAVYLVDHHTDYAAAIETYWDDPRCEEVIALYIGYLSIENKRWANTIVTRMLEPPDRDDYHRWRLAARALRDIHPDRRDIDTVELATERLRAILDTRSTTRVLADTGESLGRLGDRRDLEAFVSIDGGEYRLREGTVQVAPFEIARYPVTNQWYAKFMAAGGYANLNYWDPKGREWLRLLKKPQPEDWDSWRFNCPNAPVVGVCFHEAEAFCNWLTASRQDGYTYRLPDESQWEATAVGQEERKFPWGGWREDACNTSESNIGKPSSVGIFLAGDTPEGVSDMAGNVFEWTATKEDGEKVLRGGCWLAFWLSARCADRIMSHASQRNYIIGFRCVRTR